MTPGELICGASAANVRWYARTHQRFALSVPIGLVKPARVTPGISERRLQIFSGWSVVSTLIVLTPVYPTYGDP